MMYPVLTSILLTLLFAACIGLIRSQPYHDSQLRAFLTPPEGCPMPCFMGIRPGVTTTEEAVAILERREAVRDVRIYYDMASEIFLVEWAWNGFQPTLLDPTGLAYLSAQEGIVDTIAIETSIPFGVVWLTFGVPTQGYVAFQPEDMLHHIAYPGFRVLSWTPCPAQPEDFWRNPVQLEFGASDLSASITGETYLEHWQPGCA